MSVTVPQRAILAADLAGTGRGIKSEMVASLNRKRWRFDSEYARCQGHSLVHDTRPGAQHRGLSGQHRPEIWLPSSFARMWLLYWKRRDQAIGVL